MMDKYLVGWGDPVEVGQVRMDLKGQLGIIYSIGEDHFVIRRNETMMEFIPTKSLKIFEETTFSLGQL